MGGSGPRGGELEVTPVPPKNSGDKPVHIALCPERASALIPVLIWGRGCILLARAGSEAQSEQISPLFVYSPPSPDLAAGRGQHDRLVRRGGRSCRRGGVPKVSSSHSAPKHPPNHGETPLGGTGNALGCQELRCHRGRAGWLCR